MRPNRGVACCVGAGGHAGVCHYVEFVGEYAPYERSEESRKLDTRGCRG